MKKRYGAKKGQSVFYATANKRGMKGSARFTDAEIAQGYKVVKLPKDCMEDEEDDED